MMIEYRKFTLIEQFKKYQNNFNDSKKDDIAYRKYRNGCQRVVNTWNRRNIEHDEFYEKVYNEFQKADKKVKEKIL